MSDQRDESQEQTNGKRYPSLEHCTAGGASLILKHISETNDAIMYTIGGGGDGGCILAGRCCFCQTCETKCNKQEAET